MSEGEKEQFSFKQILMFVIPAKQGLEDFFVMYHLSTLLEKNKFENAARIFNPGFLNSMHLLL